MQIKKIADVNETIALGQYPTFPEKVEVELDNGIKADFPVLWRDVNAVDHKTPGEYTVEGDVKVTTFPKPLIEKRADPYLYKHSDGYYYFTGSYPLYDRIVLRRAKTIEALPEAEEVTVWERHESGIMSEHIWAPELHFIDDKWYLYFAAGEKDDVWEIRPYVLEAEGANPLEADWVEKGQINTEFQSFSLDATTFEHNHKRYLVWAQKVEKDTISNMYIAEMENPWTIKNQVLLSTPEYNWEQAGFYVNEGPAMIHRNGKVFIAYSGAATDDRYAMGLLTADEDSDLLNPDSWTKTPEPVFVSSDLTSEYGPGHNSFSVDEDGFDVLVYHARPYKEVEGNPLYDHNRHGRIQRLFWNQDGTPFFGVPGDTVQPTNQKAIAKIKVK